MRVHLYTQSLDEMAMLGFFFRHYDPWVERYVVYDDGSTDGTLDALHAHGRVEVRRFVRSEGEGCIAASRRLHNTHWKESRGAADWVVVTAIAEHLHHPDLPGYLSRCRRAGVTPVPALGYQMVATGFPAADRRLATASTQGTPCGPMSKLSLFVPDALKITRFDPGRHKAGPVGDVVLPARDEVMLLHDKYMGLDDLLPRQAALADRRGEDGWDAANARRYGRGELQRREFEALRRAAIDVAAPGHLPQRDHAPPRWWADLPGARRVEVS